MADMDWGTVGTDTASGAAMGATFGPWGAAAGAAVGLGMGLFGSYEKTKGAAQQAAAQQRILQGEMAQDAVRREAMEVAARRMRLEDYRKAQTAKSVALSNAATSGSQFGSGLPGGLAQIEGQSRFNQQGITSNLQLGENMFDINNQITLAKMQSAQGGAMISTGSGYQSLGQTLTSTQSMTALKGLTGLFGGPSSSAGPNNTYNPTVYGSLY